MIFIDNKPVLTLGIFAHANAGKTTLTEHLLYHTNIISDIGRVDTGNTVTDSMQIEKKRGISVRASLVSFEVNNKKVQLIDTPGHVDFSAEVERAISVLDGAVLVVSGVEGVEAQTHIIWNELKKKNIPVIIFINKMDREGADYNKVVKEMQTLLDPNIVPIINLERFDNGEILKKSVNKDEIIEKVAEKDDEILKKYLEDPRCISEESVEKTFTTMIQKGDLFPAIGGSALKDNGLDDLLKCIGEYILEYKKDIKSELSAFVYSIRVNEKEDAFAKILTGKIKIRESIKTDEETIQKVKGMYIPNGIKLKSVEYAQSGDIVILNGINVKCGQLIGRNNSNIKVNNFVKPLLNMQVIPKDKNKTLELVDALKILNIEDPYLNLRYGNKEGKIYINLMGEVQGQIIENMLEERFKINVNISNPIVIRKEVPTKVGRGKASYTSVSGVELQITPLERGSGLVYKSKLSTDFLHKKYQRQTERLVEQYTNQGLFGWQVTDAEIALIDGRFDSMGSEPSHFNIAVPLALFRALKNSDVKILEPICKYNVNTPKEAINLVVQNLSSKNSVFEITNESQGQVSIQGTARLETFLNFPVELHKLTSGLGTFGYQLERYELSSDQNVSTNYIGSDPRNEVTFVINDMVASLEPLDRELAKQKKPNRSKFQNKQREVNVVMK